MQVGLPLCADKEKYTPLFSDDECIWLVMDNLEQLVQYITITPCSKLKSIPINQCWGNWYSFDNVRTTWLGSTLRWGERAFFFSKMDRGRNKPQISRAILDPRYSKTEGSQIFFKATFGLCNIFYTSNIEISQHFQGSFGQRARLILTPEYGQGVQIFPLREKRLVVGVIQELGTRINQWETWLYNQQIELMQLSIFCCSVIRLQDGYQDLWGFGLTLCR